MITMRVRDLLTEQRTHHAINASSKKMLLDKVASMVAATVDDLNEQTVFDALIAREKLGSTGIGEGIAIPHCRLPNCQQPLGLLLQLSEAIDFDAIDNRPVDLVFVLLVPQDNPEQHLKTLSHLAALFNTDKYRQQLRTAQDTKSLYQNAVSSPAEQQL